MNKKFIGIALSTVIFSFIVFSYIVFNHKILYMNTEYPMWLHVKETVLKQNDEKQDLIMIGDSRAKAGFIPNINKSVKSLNLAVGGGTPVEGYYILKKYIENNPAPNKIIISYGPFHLDGQDCYWDRTVKFDFMEKNDYIEVENLALLIKDFKTLGSGKTYTDYLSPIKFVSDLKNGIIGIRWSRNQSVLSEGYISKGHYYFGTAKFADGLNSETSQNNFIESPLINIYFKKLLDLARQNNIQIYYYTMPFNEASFKKGKEQYRNEYTNYLKDIAMLFDIKMCNQLTYMSNDNFGDPSHLYYGAKTTTKEIFECALDNKKMSLEK